MSDWYDWNCKVNIEAPAADTPCQCGNCDWTGPFSAVADTEEADLTPGDDCPAGRCPDPECGALVYIATPEAKVKDAATRLLAALKLAETILAGAVHPACRTPGDGLDQIRAVIAEAEGRSRVEA